MSDATTLLYKVELLESIVRSQDVTLSLDNELLSLKNRIIELNEEEIRLFQKENTILKLLLVVSFIFVITTTALLLIEAS